MTDVGRPEVFLNAFSETMENKGQTKVYGCYQNCFKECNQISYFLEFWIEVRKNWSQNSQVFWLMTEELLKTLKVNWNICAAWMTIVRFIPVNYLILKCKKKNLRLLKLGKAYHIPCMYYAKNCLMSIGQNCIFDQESEMDELDLKLYRQNMIYVHICCFVYL